MDIGLGGSQELEDGGELSVVVGRALPASGCPAVVIHVPGPAGRSRVAQGGAVGSSSQRHGGHSTQRRRWPRAGTIIYADVAVVLVCQAARMSLLT